MGSYSYLTIADYSIYDVKNSYSEELLNLFFLPNDFVVEQRDYSSRNKVFWGNAYESEEGQFTFKGFRQNVKHCKQRLEIYGMSHKEAKMDFLKAKGISVEEEFYSFPINKVSFEKYLEEIEDIIINQEKNYEEIFTNLRDSLKTGDLGIYGQSIKGHLYSILSVVPEDTIIEYDLTDVLNNGWVKEKDIKQINIEKILVLTEGKTDVEFISGILFKAYPHLYDYYHFIDFDEYKVESNASALVKLVVSLVAANIKHPIIVVFDNDTTGIMEMNRLMSLQFPANFKILKYPDLKSAKKYPTIGPTGIKKMNINGLACGIEMYFGEDTLTKDNKLIPIQWKAFNEKEKKYQGEISEKSYVQEEFRKKLKSKNYLNFTDMELILQEIFNAFK